MSEEVKPKEVKVLTIDQEVSGFFKSRKSTSFENRLKKIVADKLKEINVSLDGLKVNQKNKVLDQKTGNFIVTYEAYDNGKLVYALAVHGKGTIISRNGKAYLKAQKYVLDVFYF